MPQGMEVRKINPLDPVYKIPGATEKPDYLKKDPNGFEGCSMAKAKPPRPSQTSNGTQINKMNLELEPVTRPATALPPVAQDNGPRPTTASQASNHRLSRRAS